MEIRTSINTDSVSFLYGKHLFETFIVNDSGEVFLLNEHIKRIYASFTLLFSGIDINEKDIEDTVVKYIKDKNIRNKVLRFSIFKDNNSICISFNERKNTYTQKRIGEGFGLCFSKVCKSSCSNVIRHKNGNYLDNLIELENAQKHGYDDAIFLNENSAVTETCIANIFFSVNGIVYTPELKCGLLPGIIRSWAIKTLKDEKIKVIEGAYSKNDLLKSDEIFITNSAFGIMHVNRINKTAFKKGEITASLQTKIKKEII